MKKILLVILLVAVTAAICLLPVLLNPAPRHLIAKVRYFDGSMDTIRITGYSPVGGSLWLKAEDGHFTIVGANNVIIVEDEEYCEK
jgi:hypothetical protein